MENYNKLRRPPATALRTIKGGRLSGKTDISPQWRYEIMTEVYGECGSGWKFIIERTWTEDGSNGVVFAFAQISLQVKENSKWSEPIPGVGGNQMVVKESAGLHNNDEAFKMAVTDALGTAMKMLGVAADIHAGLWDGSKYVDEPKKPTTKPRSKDKPPTPIQKMLDRFTKAKPRLKKIFGDDSIYYTGIGKLGYNHANEIKKVADGEKVLDWYLEMTKKDKKDGAEKETFPPE